MIGVSVRRFAGGLLLAACLGVACAPGAHAPNAPIRDALSARVVWTRVELRKGNDLAGEPIEMLDVRGGDLVRIESDRPIDVGERVRSGAGFAETWQHLSPRDGVITLRATLLAEAVLVRAGTTGRVHVGHGFDPGYDWYRLESDALQWAAGPIGAPFPAIAPDARIDRSEIAALDRALSDAIDHASDHEAAVDAARAIRSVVALRVVRGLHPPVGFPYFYDHDAEIGDGAQRVDDDGGLATYRIDGKNALTLTVDGPRVLHVWTKAPRPDAEDTLEVRVLEGDRLRAVSASGMPHTTAPRSDENKGIPDDDASLRRAIVHVPPGEHTYRVVTNDVAFVTPLVASPVIHLGDAVLGDKNEAGLLDDALDDAAKANAPSMRALALALYGRDGGGEWKESLAGTSPESRKIVEKMAAGGPHDPSVALEAAASNGDPAALAALGDAAMHDVDDVVRAAWLRGTLRGTKWSVEHPLEGATWTSILFDSTDTKTCTDAEAKGWTEIGADEISLAATTWRGAPTLELLSTIGCNGTAPVSFSVDGVQLRANPSSALARWHVLVSGKTTNVKRLDDGGGRLFAVSPDAAKCGAHFGAIGAPSVASEAPKLEFAPEVTAPGVEIWLRNGSKGGQLVVSRGPEESVRIFVAPENGFAAIDAGGTRWVRVARLALPTWASKGAVVHGPDDFAVRAIVRAPRAIAAKGGGPIADPYADIPTTTKEAEPLDEARLAKISRELLASRGIERGKKHLERGRMLAAGGASRAALEDARAAKSLGALGPKGEDPIALVSSEIRPLPKKPLALPTGVAAYGVEADFDPGAPRCGMAKDGPRAKLAALLDELKTARAATTKTFDAKLALRAFEAMTDNPIDPRGPAIFQRALAGSRWMTPRTVDGNPLKVQRPSDGPLDGALDADGELRARVLVGQPFDRGSYATIDETHPAKAALTGNDGATARVEVVCAPRSAADAIGTHCPFAVTVGTSATIHPIIGDDGHAFVDLPELPQKGKKAQVVLSIDPSPARWTAIARIVFDRELPATTYVENVGWVLQPPGLQYRFLLKNGEQLSAPIDQPTLVRVDAIAEPEDHPHVVLVVDGKEIPVATDGAPHVFAVTKAGSIHLKSTGGAVTVRFAERVARAALPDPLGGTDEAEPDPMHAEIAEPNEPTAATTTALLDANAAGLNAGTWRDVAERSPRPMTTFEEDFGTVTTHVLGRYGTYREGILAMYGDGYVEQAIGYRRKIESIGLWTGFGGTVRERELSPTFAAHALFYEEFERLRVTGWFEYWTQDIPGFGRVRTFKPRGFVEYSIRVTPSFFVLPRVGWDGYYINASTEPKSLFDVDDDVFNSFRFRHPSEAFAQLLDWWVPYVNDIVYLRGRVTADASARVVDHYALRLGDFLAVGNMEIGAYGDVAYYRSEPGFRPVPIGNVTGAGYALYNMWSNDGSLDVQAGVGGRARTYDYGWEVYALVNVFASFHRGLRDFTSLELNFPEPLGGGIAWRGPMAGGGN